MRIGAHAYRLAIVPRPDDDPAEADVLRNTIEVAEAAADSAKIEFLIHELLHGLWSDSGLDFSDRIEERVIRALAPRVGAFLHDNYPAAWHELLRALRCADE